MSAIDSDVQQILFKNNITEETLRSYALANLPMGYTANLPLVAKVYVSCVLKQSLPEKGRTSKNLGVVKVKDLTQGNFATINVIIIQKLGSMTYLGCPECNKGIKEAQEGDPTTCPNSKCEKEIVVTKLYWPRYVAGDETGEIIVKMSIADTDSEDYSGNIVRLRGMLTEYKGVLDFTVNKIEDTVALPSLKTTSAPAGGVSAPAGDTSTREAENPEMKALLERFNNFVTLFIKTNNTDTQKLVTWFQKQSADKGLNITVEQALDKVGYTLREGKLIKK